MINIKFGKKENYNTHVYQKTATNEITTTEKQQQTPFACIITPLVFTREKIRKVALVIISNPLFDRFILTIIMVNCVFMIMSDYEHVDDMNNLSSDGSIRNEVILSSEIYFTAIFTCEFLLKWAALNIYGLNSYFYDPWNWLDFIVVVTSLIALAPNIPSIKVLRTFRVLRPLKSLRSLPAVADIVEVFVASIFKMGDIFGLIMFSYLFFAVIGLQIFNGPYMHTRCRLTPFPVTLSFQNMVFDGNTTIEAFERYRCLNASNVDYPGQSPDYTKASSPWNTQHPECYWPVDINDRQLCTLTGNVVHVCQNGHDTNLPINQWRWCGSSYDALGNDRFGGNATMMDNYLPENGYGWINFDNFGLSFLTVIQAASGDSWSSIQYQIFDSFGVIAGAVFFNVIILVCLFFLQQLIIAILEDMFSIKMREKKEKKNRNINMATKALGFMQKKRSELDIFKEELDRKISSGNISYSLSEKEADIEANNITPMNDSLHANAEIIEVKNDNVENANAPKHRPSLIRSTSVNSTGSSQSRNNTQPQQLSRSNSSEVSDRSGGNPDGSKARPLLTRQTSTRSASNSDTGKAIVQTVISFINRYDKPQSNAFRRGCRVVAESFLFQQFFTVAILVNTAMFAYDHHPMRQSISDGFEAISFVLTLLFTVELLLTLLGFGIVESFSTWFGCFDFVIVLVSVLDITLSPIPVLLSHSRPKVVSKNSLTALRTFRLFRLLRLFKSPTLKEVVAKIMDVISSMGNFLVLLLLFHIIFALIGMQFFANRFRFDAQGIAITEINSDAWVNAPDRPRSNFDNFSLAAAAIFQMVTIDNWSVIMFNVFRAFGPFAMLFPLCVYLSGSVLLMNLFLALLIRNFSDNEDEEDTSDSQTNNKSDSPSQAKLSSPAPLRPILTKFNSMMSMSSGASEDGTFLQDYCSKLYCCCCLSCVFESSICISIQKTLEPYRKFCRSVCGDCNDDSRSNTGAWIFEGFILTTILLSCILLIIDSPLEDPNSYSSFILYSMDICITAIFSAEMLLKMFSFGLYGAKDAYFADGWNILDCFVVAISIFSVITVDNKSLQSLGSLRALRALRPLKLVNRLPGLRIIVQALFGAATEIMNIAILVFFVFFIFAIFFTSFFKGQLRSCGGDVFDNVISVNSSYMDLLTYPVPWNSMTPWQQSLFREGSPLLNASSLSSISTIFVNSSAVLDCSAVGNCCPNWSFLDLDDDAPNSRQICECWGGGWYPVTDWRFDNVAQSLMTLFDDATVDNWSDNMHFVSDSNGVDMQPIRDNQIYWIYAFCGFTLIGNYFCLQLFIGSITANFEKSRKKLGGLAGMTKAQQEWVETRRIMKAIKPRLRAVRPKSLFLRILYDVTTHWALESFIIFMIILQCLVLSMHYFGQDDMYSEVIDALEVALTAIFAIEMAMKLVSLTVRVYFQDMWNRLDCAIVVCFIGALLNSLVTGAGNQAVVNVVRVLRIARLLRVLKSLETLQILLDTVAFTVPGVINVSMLVLLTVYIFSVVCVQLFAKVAYNNSYYEDVNFRTFGITFTVLYRFLTGDNWGQFVVDLSQNTPDCVNDPPYNASYCGFNDQPGCIPLNGCGSIVAYPVLVLFMLFTTLILLSVFISIIISNYKAVKESPIKTIEFGLFAEHWSHFDPHATRYIPYNLLFPLVATMFEPFGFAGKKFSRRQYGKRVSGVKVNKDKKVFFSDVLAALSKAHFERNVRTAHGEVFKLKKKKMQSVLQLNTRRFSNAAMSTLETISSNLSPNMRKSIDLKTDYPLELEEFTVAHYLAVDLIYEAWDRRKWSRRTGESGSSSSPISFYERNLHAYTSNEKLQNDVRQFIKHKEEKTLPRKSLKKGMSPKFSLTVRMFNSMLLASNDDSDSQNNSLHEDSRNLSYGSLEIQYLSMDRSKETEDPSVHGHEEPVSYSDRRVAPPTAISGRFNFPIYSIAVSEESFLSVVNEDTDSSVLEEKGTDDYFPFQPVHTQTQSSPLPFPSHLQFSPSDFNGSGIDTSSPDRQTSSAKRYVHIDNLLGDISGLGLFSSPYYDYRRDSSPGAFDIVEIKSSTARSSELRHASRFASVFDLNDVILSSAGRSKSLPFDGRRLARDFSFSPDMASTYSDQNNTEDFPTPESFIASIDKYYELPKGEPFATDCTDGDVLYRDNPQQIDGIHAGVSSQQPPLFPPPYPTLLSPHSNSITPKGDKIREISALFEKSKSSSPHWDTPLSSSSAFGLETGMNTRTGQGDQSSQHTDLASSSRSKASQDRVKKLAALFEIDPAMLLSFSSSSSIVITKK